MKLKLCNIQFSKISIFRLKKKKSFTDEKLLRIVSLIHWNFSSTDLKNGFGGADSPALKRFIGGHHITSCPIQLTINGLGFQLSLT
jgi:hypothetical protein